MRKIAYRIYGGKRLGGSVTVSGSKNAALPILFAATMIKEPVTLLGVPDIGDVQKTLALLKKMGASVQKKGSALTLCARELSLPSFAEEEIGELRASSYLLGAGLSRFGEMSMVYPGGCNLGTRPLDIHRRALCALGALWEEDGGRISVEGKRLKGAEISLSYPSVGATVNALLSALGAEGETVIRGIAAEPHVACFIRFLCEAGADITVDESTVRIKGKTPLHGCCFTVIPDEIEASTFLIGGALLQSAITVKGVLLSSLSPLFSLFDRMHIGYTCEKNAVTVHPSEVQGTNIVCAPHPAFPTDLQPLAALLLGSTKDGGGVRDCVWRERFAYVRELKKMGFLAKESNGSLSVYPARLHGAHVCATDLRGGAALTLAALSAEGESVVENTVLVERGYESFLEKWKMLGAIAEHI